MRRVFTHVLKSTLKLLTQRRPELIRAGRTASQSGSSGWPGPPGQSGRILDSGGSLRFVDLVVSSGGAGGQRSTRSRLDVNKSHPLPPLPLLRHLREHRRSKLFTRFRNISLSTLQWSTPSAADKSINRSTERDLFTLSTATSLRSLDYHFLFSFWNTLYTQGQTFPTAHSRFQIKHFISASSAVCFGTTCSAAWAEASSMKN